MHPLFGQLPCIVCRDTYRMRHIPDVAFSPHHMMHISVLQPVRSCQCYVCVVDHGVTYYVFALVLP